MTNNPLLMRDDFDLAVASERERQHAKWGEQNLPDGTALRKSAEVARAAKHGCDRVFKEGNGTWSHILLEEVYEVLAEGDPEKLKTELIQLAAVCKQWVEAIDRRRHR